MLRERLDRIRERITQLARLDTGCSVFGATRHSWEMAPPASAAELEAFERLHDVALPEEVRAFFEGVLAAGAGPYYGLSPLPTELEEETVRGTRALELAKPFVGDAPDAESVVACDPSLRGGYLVLADQGCGYESVLVLSGPRRGEVLADMREAHEGFYPEAPSFLAWYETWLDDAIVEWAMAALPDVVRLDAAEREDHVSAGIEAAAPLLEQRADLSFRSPRDVLYPPAPDAERIRALVFLHAYRGNFERAFALVDRVRDLDLRDAEPLRTLTLARLAGAQSDYARQLALAEEGLADDRSWFATRTDLLREKERALLALGRRADAITTVYERAKHSRELFAYYDLAWMRIEDGDIAGGADAVIDAARAGIGCANEGPLGARAAEAGAGIIDALEGAGEDAVAAAMRARLAAAREHDA